VLEDPNATTADLLSAADAAFTSGQAAETIALYGRVLERDPVHALALRRLAWIEEASGRVTQAIQLLCRLIAASPTDARAHQDLGLCLLRVQNLNDAIESFRRTTKLDPTYAVGFCNLGLALEDAGDVAGALAALRRAHELDPGSGFIAYHLAAIQTLAGKSETPPPICPPRYLLQLFDGYADRFDAHLFEQLHYQGPALLAEIVSRTEAGKPRQPWDILDIGCGTGMTAVPFREGARRVVGVDLSSRMLRHASTRTMPDGTRVYDELVQADLIDALQARPASADLVLSADVFIYIGNLRPVFAAVWGALRENGMFAFTVESYVGPQDYCLLPSRRYAHSQQYIAQLAGEFGFTLNARNECVLRKGDDGLPLKGDVYLLSRMEARPSSA
jgi:predicted TPR repeat methyltransferase